MISLLLAKQIGELFLMIFMGFLTVRLRLLQAEDSRTLSVITLYLILPCVILHAFQVSYTPALRNGLLLALFAAILVHVVLLLLNRLFTRLFHLEPVEQASIVYSNAGNLIIPIVTAVMGTKWLIYSAVFIAVQTVFLWTHCRMILSRERRVDWRKILLNVNMLSIFIGVVLFLLHIPLPSLLDNAMNAVGVMIGPVCMLVAGMLMATLHIRQVLAYRRMYLILFLKMIVCPVVLLAILKDTGLAQLLPNAKWILLTTLLAVSAPSASTVTQMAQIYDNHADYASVLNVVTTLICIVTMPVMVWLYQR